LHKLKAGLTAVIGNDKDLIYKAKTQYFNTRTICIEDGNFISNSDTNGFLDFLNQDDKIFLEGYISLKNSKIEEMEASFLRDINDS